MIKFKYIEYYLKLLYIIHNNFVDINHIFKNIGIFCL